MELYKKYRPKTLKGIVGNEATVQTLTNMVNKGKIPHTVLFSGPSGCGKTTLARILKGYLNCSDMDFKELNCSDFRGVDTIREITQIMNLSPVGGDTKIWLLDECFHSNTKVLTSKGYIPIFKIKKGDSIHNLKGLSEVEKVFKNHVSLDRIVRIDLSNGRTIFTTKQHLFMTDRGWKESQNLNRKDLLLSPVSDTLFDSPTRKEGQNEVSVMRKDNIKPTEVLFHSMFQQSKRGEEEEGKEKQHHLSRVWKRVLVPAMRSQKILFQKLFGKEQKSETRVSKKAIFSESEEENFKEIREMETIQGRVIGTKEMFKTNEKEQPHVQSYLEEKSSGNKKDKRNTSCLEREKGRKWEINRTPKIIGVLLRMGSRISCILGKHQKRFSDELQNRYSQPRTTIWDRNRWGWASVERSNPPRSKENQETEEIRVENYQVYKPGSNDQSFRGIIENKERDQGYVEFYDLQIKGHPSYCVEGVFVHNCHALTKDAQNAALKILEDTPSHVYFFLCTTDPQKILPTIRTRCCNLEVELLTSEECKKLIQRVLRHESQELDISVIEKIADVCGGSARKTLVTLERVLNLPESKREASLKDDSETSAEVIELCRALIKREPWNKVASILKGIKEDPESVRYAVLGYAKSCLLGGSHQAAIIIEAFQENFYDSKEAGLVLASYVCIKKM